MTSVLTYANSENNYAHSEYIHWPNDSLNRNTTTTDLQVQDNRAKMGHCPSVAPRGVALGKGGEKMKPDAFIVSSTAGNWFGFYGSIESARIARDKIKEEGDADGIRWTHLRVKGVKYTRKGKGFDIIEDK